MTYTGPFIPTIDATFLCHDEKYKNPHHHSEIAIVLPLHSLTCCPLFKTVPLSRESKERVHPTRHINRPIYTYDIMSSTDTTSKPAAPVEPSPSHAADPAALPQLPKDHLDHPEQWVTGAEPATEKQKGFIRVLEGKNEELVPPQGLDVEAMGKSEASEVIDKLKNGKSVGSDDASDAKRTEEKAVPAPSNNGSASNENPKRENTEETEAIEVSCSMMERV